MIKIIDNDFKADDRELLHTVILGCEVNILTVDESSANVGIWSIGYANGTELNQYIEAIEELAGCLDKSWVLTRNGDTWNVCHRPRCPKCGAELTASKTSETLFCYDDLDGWQACSPTIEVEVYCRNGHKLDADDFPELP